MARVRPQPRTQNNEEDNDKRVLRFLGMDPSFRNWGYAVGHVDVDTLEIEISRVEVFTTSKSQVKTVRRTSDDFASARALHTKMTQMIQQHEPHVLFSEIPAGSQSATASKGLGIAVGVLASAAVPLIQVQPLEVKLALTGNKTASKLEMMERAVEMHPESAGWLYRTVKSTPVLLLGMEHAADAVGAGHAGILTPQFQELLALLKEMRS